MSEDVCFKVKTKDKDCMVCILPNKRGNGMDLILVKDHVARSMRSTTELLNNLTELGIEFEQIDSIMKEVSKRLLLR